MQLCSYTDEAGRVAPAVVFDRGVDGELDHHTRPDGCVEGGRAGSAPAGGRQRVWPRMAGPGVRVQQRGDRVAAGGCELGGAPDEVKLAVVVVAAQQQHAWRIERADDAADDPLRR